MCEQDCVCVHAHVCVQQGEDRWGGVGAVHLQVCWEEALQIYRGCMVSCLWGYTNMGLGQGLSH